MKREQFLSRLWSQLCATGEDEHGLLSPPTTAYLSSSFKSPRLLVVIDLIEVALVVLVLFIVTAFLVLNPAQVDDTTLVQRGICVEGVSEGGEGEDKGREGKRPPSCSVFTSASTR